MERLSGKRRDCICFELREYTRFCIHPNLFNPGLMEVNESKMVRKFLKREIARGFRSRTV
ncbi:MAG: hypothetical protein AMS17_06575 [Spirochaetes bacterium DG_61]|nr:MAG: hypothetical protein AMS17_06575 [Spirochaetes bacterium DG_61]